MTHEEFITQLHALVAIIGKPYVPVCSRTDWPATKHGRERTNFNVQVHHTGSEIPGSMGELAFIVSDWTPEGILRQVRAELAKLAVMRNMKDAYHQLLPVDEVV